MTTFFKNFKILNFDIIVIQEFWANKFQSIIHFFNSQIFNFRYENQITLRNKKSRICWIINKRIFVNKIIYYFYFKNLITMKLSLNKSNLKIRVFKIHNIYNESYIKSILALKLLKFIFNDVTNQIQNIWKNIIIDDFNIYYFQWENFYIKFDNKNKQFLNLID